MSNSGSDIKNVLKSDSGVQQIVRLYACMNDWYANIHQERRGVRACERVCQVRDRGLIPLAQRYFEFVASHNGLSYTVDCENLIQEWASEFRPDYVEESEDHTWNEWSRSLQRVHLDPECRIATFAHNASIEVNNHTINAYNIDRVSESLEEEFESLWKDWWYRFDDLYWERRYRLSKEIVREMERDILTSEDKTWERRKKKYPEFPMSTVLESEKKP